MKLYYYQGAEPNFGDELNHWLMPKVLPGLLDDNEAEMLLAIGSVLYDNYAPSIKKIVLGTGWGGYTPPPMLDEKWDVHCVRGPLTANALGLPEHFVAGDAAILLRDHYKADPIKRVKVSFIPHFESIGRGHWREACKLAGIRFIDPRLPVLEVMKKICESEVVITEAMHGAIVSDALRVPWIAMKPNDPRHHMKWNDWAGALDLDVRFRGVSPSSMREAFLVKSGREAWRLETNSGWLPIAVKPLDVTLVGVAAISLFRTAKLEPQLSGDIEIERATDKLRSASIAILKAYAAS
jgi:hypothetical protein